MTIEKIINATQMSGDKLSEYVESSFEELTQFVNTSYSISPVKTPESRGVNHTIRYIAIGLITLGVIGWIGTNSDSVWPKISLGGGVVLSAYDLMRGNKKGSPKSGDVQAVDNLKLPKQEIQQKIKDIINNSIVQWDKLTISNKGQVMALIESSQSSSENKFAANNTASLPRKISFSILPYVAKIVSTKSTNDLMDILFEIKEALLKDIKDTVSCQVDDYKHIAQTTNLE